MKGVGGQKWERTGMVYKIRLFKKKVSVQHSHSELINLSYMLTQSSCSNYRQCDLEHAGQLPYNKYSTVSLKVSHLESHKNQSSMLITTHIRGQCLQLSQG